MAGDTLRRPRLRPDHALGDPGRHPRSPGLPDRALGLLREHSRNGSALNPVERLHEAYGSSRRARVLARQLAEQLPPRGRLLDVGCGDGEIDRLIGETHPDLQMEGIDVLVRPDASIPVTAFDGRKIPHPDDSFDGVLFVDVLHHSDDATELLREARRVARDFVLIKDHRLNGLLAGPTLRFMDDVGNARHGVALPYNYWSHERWHEAFESLTLEVTGWKQELGIYPWPASWVFGRGLHFIARLGVAAGGGSGAAGGP
ncbi:MAG: class I SAM-dependent methyltransferase [Deltaproteobacteria bacterium]|nr:class I SAM-dependent methyltransferase [Deltaproteobacteria bacterium]